MLLLLARTPAQHCYCPAPLPRRLQSQSFYVYVSGERHGVESKQPCGARGEECGVRGAVRGVRAGAAGCGVGAAGLFSEMSGLPLPRCGYRHGSVIGSTCVERVTLSLS